MGCLGWCSLRVVSCMCCVMICVFVVCFGWLSSCGLSGFVVMVIVVCVIFVRMIWCMFIIVLLMLIIVVVVLIVVILLLLLIIVGVRRLWMIFFI